MKLILLGSGVVIFADAECFQILDFLFLDFLLVFSSRVLHCRRPCCLSSAALYQHCVRCLREIFATSDGPEKHRTIRYLIGTPCHVLDDGFTRAHLVSTARVTMSTAMLKKLKASRRKHRSITKKALMVLILLI